MNIKKVATCSSDATVKLWKINEEMNKENKGKIICTFAEHSDYVMRIAYSKQHKLLASAGLDKKILIWDIEKGVSFNSPDNFNSNSFFQDGDYSYFSLFLIHFIFLFFYFFLL